MGILKTDTIMQNEPTDFTLKILDFLTAFIPYSVVFGVFWKVIDAVLKYATDGRDTRTKELIAEVTEPLSKDIKDLTKSIWELGKKIEK